MSDFARQVIQLKWRPLLGGVVAIGMSELIEKAPREAVLGIPAIILWQYFETKVSATPNESIQGIAP